MSELTWIKSTNQQALVPGAVLAGNDSDGSPIYVGRTSHEGEILPVNVIPSRQAAYVGSKGLELSKTYFEVLSGNTFTWVKDTNGNVPTHAVSTGRTKTGELIYVGRAHHEKSLTVGKVLKSLGGMYLPYYGVEHVKTQYEVLVSGQAPVQNRIQWIKSTAEDPMPPGAVQGGKDADGSPIYIGRTEHKGEQVIVKVIPKKKVGYISFQGEEIPKLQFDVLCNGNVSWVKTDNGRIVANAVPGGRTATGEILYIGRISYADSVTVGKIHPSHRKLYIAFGGKEFSFQSYEILIEK